MTRKREPARKPEEWIALWLRLLFRLNGECGDNTAYLRVARLGKKKGLEGLQSSLWETRLKAEAKHARAPSTNDRKS